MIGHVAPAAPIALEVPLVIIGLAVISLYITMLGLKKGYGYSIGALLALLADVLDFKVWRFRVNLGAGIAAMNNAIEDAIAAGLADAEAVVGAWWHAQETVWRWTWDSLAWFANQVTGAIESLVAGTIPQAITVTVRPVTARIGRLQRALDAQAARLQAQLVRRAAALEAELDRDFGQAWRGIDALRKTLTGRLDRALDGVTADVAALERAAFHRLPRRIAGLEARWGALVLGGVGVAALTRVFGYWQCRNVRRGARALCRMDGSLLDAMLLDAVAIVGAISLVDFAEALLAVESEVAAGVTAGFRETRGL